MAPSSARRWSPGEIATLRGLTAVRIGDPIGVARPGAREHFAPPSLETVVEPVHRAQKGALHAALAQLAEQDPLINLRQDDTVSLYGEVQKEVIQATLAGEYGLDVTFRETTTICVERPAGSGAAVEVMGVEPNPFLATVGPADRPGAGGFRGQLRPGGGAGGDAVRVLQGRRGHRRRGPWPRVCTAGR